jgi:hypothetical protein
MPVPFLTGKQSTAAFAKERVKNNLSLLAAALYLILHIFWLK